MGKYGSLKVASPSRQYGANAAANRGISSHGANSQPASKMSPSVLSHFMKHADPEDVDHLHPDDAAAVKDHFKKRLKEDISEMIFNDKD